MVRFKRLPTLCNSLKEFLCYKLILNYLGTPYFVLLTYFYIILRESLSQVDLFLERFSVEVIGRIVVSEDLTDRLDFVENVG